MQNALKILINKRLNLGPLTNLGLFFQFCSSALIRTKKIVCHGEVKQGKDYSVKDFQNHV